MNYYKFKNKYEVQQLYVYDKLFSMLIVRQNLFLYTLSCIKDLYSTVDIVTLVFYSELYFIFCLEYFITTI